MAEQVPLGVRTTSFCPYIEKPCRKDCRFYASNDFGFGYCKRGNTVYIAEAIDGLAESVIALANMLTEKEKP
jgi:hypothetical protein